MPLLARANPANHLHIGLVDVASPSLLGDSPCLAMPTARARALTLVLASVLGLGLARDAR